MPDKNLTCVECAKQFTFTDKEQQFYTERGFQEPKRCSSCRAARKRNYNYDRSGSNSEYKGPSRW